MLNKSQFFIGQSNKCQNKIDIGHGDSSEVVYEKYFYEIRSWSDLEFLARQRPQNWTITCQTFSKIEYNSCVVDFTNSDWILKWLLQGVSVRDYILLVEIKLPIRKGNIFIDD